MVARRIILHVFVSIRTLQALLTFQGFQIGPQRMIKILSLADFGQTRSRTLDGMLQVIPSKIVELHKKQSRILMWRSAELRSALSG
jgi:hypothetical protein